jgi:DNA-binding response OmpR family regulator
MADEPAGMPLRVLVVEDDATSLRFLSLFLTRSGLSVSQAKDADSALRLAAESRPDVVVMDWKLPDSTGVQLLRDLRSRFGDTLPAIALSGYPRETQDADELALFSAYVTKPIDDLDAFPGLVRSVAESRPNPAARGC